MLFRSINRTTVNRTAINRIATPGIAAHPISALWIASHGIQSLGSSTPVRPSPMIQVLVMQAPAIRVIHRAMAAIPAGLARLRMGTIRTVRLAPLPWLAPAARLLGLSGVPPADLTPGALWDGPSGTGSLIPCRLATCSA